MSLTEHDLLKASAADVQQLLDALKNKDNYLVRNDLVKRWIDTTFQEWIDTMTPSVRVLFDAIDANVPYVGVWLDARLRLIQGQQEAAHQS